MAYNAAGHIRLPGNPVIGTGSGSQKSLHFYVTNDTTAELETGGYFNEVADLFSTGDALIATIDIDDTPAGKMYVVTVSGGAVSLTAFA